MVLFLLFELLAVFSSYLICTDVGTPMQEAMLKEELRNMERSKKREGVDMTYLKNVILKLLETGTAESDLQSTVVHLSCLIRMSIKIKMMLKVW